MQSNPILDCGDTACQTQTKYRYGRSAACSSVWHGQYVTRYLSTFSFIQVGPFNACVLFLQQFDSLDLLEFEQETRWSRVLTKKLGVSWAYPRMPMEVDRCASSTVRQSGGHFN